MDDGAHIGYYNPGSGFYPNQKGEERGIPKMRQREFNAYLKQKKAKAEEQKILPFRTSVFIGEGGTLSGLFWETNRRIPRFEGQPEKAPAPLPYNRYRPQELSDVTLNELLLAVDSKGAEEEFRKLYPEDKYPNLYKHGKTAGIIEGKDPTEI